VPINREIEIFMIGQTGVNAEEVERWLEHLGVNLETFQWPENEISSPEFLVALAAKRCYMSFEPGLNPNVTRVRREYVDYLENVLRQGHGSVFEHAFYNFAIEGVSRVFTAEMNRHRAGWAISEGSLRFIRFDKDLPYWLPLSIREDPNDDPDLADRKRATRAVFDRVFRYVEDSYGELLRTWDLPEGHHNFTYKKHVTSCLRRIVPLGVATGGVWSGNLRAVRHVLARRTDEAAEEEIFHGFSRLGDEMIAAAPTTFSDFERAPSGGLAPRYRKV
jgi:thymidylate synthase (FAD)